MQQADPKIGEDLGPQALRLLFSRPNLQSVPLVDRRAYDEGLASGPNLSADEVVGLRALFGRARHPSGYGPASRWELVERRHIQVPVVGERERPGDRGGRHDENVGVGALLLQRDPLVDPEAMLFVDDDEGEVRELDSLFDEGVGPHRQVDGAVRNAGNDPLAILACHRRGQHRVRDRPGTGWSSLEQALLARREGPIQDVSRSKRF